MRHPVKVMVWGIFSHHGAGRLHIVEGNMDRHQYLRVLQGRVRQQMQEWFSNNNGIFMQDKAPCHTAKICSNYLSQQNFQVLDWPGNSPDLNPIENLWAIIKSQLRQQNLLTKNELICAVINSWSRDATLLPKLHSLIDSMPQRIQAVIKGKGGFTKY